MVGIAEINGETVEMSCCANMVCSLDGRDGSPCTVPQRIFSPLCWHTVLPALSKRWLAVRMFSSRRIPNCFNPYPANVDKMAASYQC